MAATIREYMRIWPHCIAPEQKLYEARKMMRENGIRHLPVVADDRLVGIITEGDVRVVESLEGVDPKQVPIEFAMTREPYAVSPDEPLARVTRTMAERDLGSAVVVEQGRVVGLFTARDAVQALALVLGRRRSRAVR